MDLTTRYLGLTLENPIIAGSSGLTDSVEKVKTLEKSGAGAVILKSIFEEEIVFEHEDIMQEAKSAGADMDQFEYYDFHLRGKKLDAYVDLIEKSKAKTSIPIIASINCVYSHEWISFAKKIEDAGGKAVLIGSE